MARPQDVRQKDIPSNFEDALRQLVESHHRIDALEAECDALKAVGPQHECRHDFPNLVNCSCGWVGNQLTGNDWFIHKSQCEVEAIIARISPEGQLALDALLVSTAEQVERKWMWQSHGHDGIYGDDGEMQCGECHVDYKREPIEVVTAAYQKARMDIPALLAKTREQALEGIRDLEHAALDVIEWENEYRTLNNLGKNPPDPFVRLAICVANRALKGGSQ